MQTEQSTLGYLYGSIHPTYRGVILDITKLPDGTHFFVSNGYWWGMIDTENGQRVIYTGINDIGNYINKLAISNEEPYDVAVGKIKVKEKGEWMLYTEKDIQNAYDEYHSPTETDKEKVTNEIEKEEEQPDEVCKAAETGDGVEVTETQETQETQETLETLGTNNDVQKIYNELLESFTEQSLTESTENKIEQKYSLAETPSELENTSAQSKSTRPTKDEYYLKIAEAVLERSTCLRRKYGAVLVKNDEIVSTGYNGSCRGEANCCDVGYCEREAQNIPKGERYELCVAIHAEDNAITSAGRHKACGATLYIVGKNTTDNTYANPAPCLMCRRKIVNAGIARVVGLVDGKPQDIGFRE